MGSQLCKSIPEGGVVRGYDSTPPASHAATGARDQASRTHLIDAILPIAVAPSSRTSHEAEPTLAPPICSCCAAELGANTTTCATTETATSCTAAAVTSARAAGATSSVGAATTVVTAPSDDCIVPAVPAASVASAGASAGASAFPLAAGRTVPPPLPMVVFADGCAATRTLYERCFSRMGFVTLSLDSGPAVLHDYCQWRVSSVAKGPSGVHRYADVVILDADLPGMPGAQVAERLFEEGFHGAVVLLASPQRRATTAGSPHAGAIPLSVAAVVCKPVRMAILRELMHELVPRARELISQAAAAREVREAAHASLAQDHNVTPLPMPPARPPVGGRGLQASRISHAARARGGAASAAPPRASSSAAFDRALSELGRSGAAATYPASLASASAYTGYSATPFPV